MRQLFWNTDQRDTLAGFFNGIAKGVFLAAMLGQGLVEKLSGKERLVVSISWTIIALLFLLVTLYLKRNRRKKR